VLDRAYASAYRDKGQVAAWKPRWSIAAHASDRLGRCSTAYSSAYRDKGRGSSSGSRGVDRPGERTSLARCSTSVSCSLTRHRGGSSSGSTVVASDQRANRLERCSDERTRQSYRRNRGGRDSGNAVAIATSERPAWRGDRRAYIVSYRDKGGSQLGNCMWTKRQRARLARCSTRRIVSLNEATGEGRSSGNAWSIATSDEPAWRDARTSIRVKLPRHAEGRTASKLAYSKRERACP